MRLSRRVLLQAGGLGLAPGLASAARRAPRDGPGPVQASWESLAEHYQTPQWFRDAKFGIWAVWGPQCVPEFGDWYARQMYQQGNPVYEHHVKTYGHPSQFGFMEFIHRWKADKWEPERLIGLYKAAGAKYFVSMANHHDNLDMFPSRHHAWNTTRVGPKRNIVGTWAKAARGAGLRFGVSNHAGHAWHWWQVAYGYDAEGPLAGVRYDAYRLTKADGRGAWWQGLDPQELYTGRARVIPDGVKSIKDMDAWHDVHDGGWEEQAPGENPAFTRQWLLRCNDLVDQMRPDFLYFDNTALPLGQAGLDATAHYYNANRTWNGGKLEAVVTGKLLTPLQRLGMTEDVERGFSDILRPDPWQTDTCIGNWHYDRGLYERDGYQKPKAVIQRLADVVAKNGNLLLSIPVRGDGSIDDKEEAILTALASWMRVNEAAIFGSRPWKIYGEGPTKVTAGIMNEGGAKPFTAADLRFTTKDGALYVLGMDWPQSEIVVKSLGLSAPTAKDASISRIELLGAPGQSLNFTQTADALRITLPDARPAFTPVLKISGRGLA